jgi:hypothetical protein
VFRCGGIDVEVPRNFELSVTCGYIYTRCVIPPLPGNRGNCLGRPCTVTTQRQGQTRRAGSKCIKHMSKTLHSTTIDCE